VFAAALCLFVFAAAGQAEYRYRFDDVYGPSGVRGQWVIAAKSVDADGITEYTTRGNPRPIFLETAGNFVNSRDHVYSSNGKGTELNVTINNTVPLPIDHIFMVIPRNSVTAGVDFTWADPGLNPTEVFTGDVRIGEDYYFAAKDPLGPINSFMSRFSFRFRFRWRLFNRRWRAVPLLFIRLVDTSR
jgi:hypothetical protein